MTTTRSEAFGVRRKGLPPLPSHKFAIGVRVIQKFGAATGTDSFSISRHLPDAGAGLQYRMKRERDGQERVAVESALELVAREDFMQ